MKYELKQDGRWIYIRPFPDPKLLLLLESEFTYIRKGSQFMANPLWAQVKLYNRTKGRLPIGLLNKCEHILSHNGYEYSKLIQGSSLLRLYQKDDSLYDFQKSALRMILLRGGGILQIPTGGGKTRIAIAAIKTINVPTLVVVPTLDLVEQWKPQLPDNAIVKTYQSLKSKKYIQQFGLVVFDECHRVAAKTLQLIGLNLSEEAITLGLSATPMMRNDDNLKVESVIGSIIYKISLRELINEDYLVDALVHYHYLSPMDTTFMNYTETYHEYIIKNNERNNKIIQLAKEAKGPVLILVKLIQHGDMLQMRLFADGHDSIFLNGSIKERDKKMEHKIIIATSIFDEGIDIPHLETLIIAGGGKSAIQTTQRIGRVLRKFPGKSIAMVHDFADNCKWLKQHYEERRAIYENDFEVVDVE
jgi:superfamily II DNA or RNA helicase